MEWTAAARVRISGGRGSAIDRAVFPSPYAAEEIVEDVEHAGLGARVEIDVDGLGAPEIAALESGIARIVRRGVPVIWNGLQR